MLYGKPTITLLGANSLHVTSQNDGNTSEENLNHKGGTDPEGNSNGHTPVFSSGAYRVDS